MAFLYNVTDLGLGGVAEAINNAATPMAVGATWISGLRQSFVYKAGSVSLPVPLASVGAASSVNDSEVVVGVFGNDRHTGRAYSYDAGTDKLLDLQAQLGATNGEARDVNNSNLVVGGTWDGTNLKAFVYALKQKTLTNIPVPAGMPWSLATAINGTGKVAGMVWNSADYYGGHKAFLYDHTTGSTAAALSEFSPYDINDAGVIVGSGPTGPVVCSPPGYAPVVIGPNSSGTPTSRGVGFAYGINNSGVVVGSVDLGPTTRAFVYSLTSGIFQFLDSALATAGWHLITADHVNDAGMIVASGQNPSGFPRAVLLTPV